MRRRRGSTRGPTPCPKPSAVSVRPGVGLVGLLNVDDLWIQVDLREDLVKTLKVGDRFGVRIPALGDRLVTVEVKLIATKGEYASWRATRATGDFDLRTFSIRAYPVETVPELRPGMSAYLDWRTRGGGPQPNTGPRLLPGPQTPAMWP